jgi:hypothetical protein
LIIEFLQKFEGINDILFGWFDKYIENLPIVDWAKDAICDSVHLLPFLFIIFVLIELFERFYSHKIKDLSHGSKKFGPLIGSVLAGLPQCGFSVIATPLYINKVITRGTLIAIYISTSDEAIPILLSNPKQFSVVLPLLLIKITLGIFAGYMVDLLLPQKEELSQNTHIDENDDIGCCSHHVTNLRKRELFYHPLKHTFNIFIMILVISLGLNFCFDAFGNDILNRVLLNNSILQPVISAIIGLIPNCAVSVLLTMLYIGGVLSFASVIAGLSSGAGLGLIVLLKRNPDFKDSAKIIGILLSVSIIAGLLISLFK